jgi:ribosomal protein S6
MDSKVHEYILNEILRYFEINDEIARYLIVTTSRPDRKAREKIEDFEPPEPKEWYDHIRNMFLAAGNAFVASFEWINFHSSQAPGQFITHLEIAKEILIESPSRDRVRKEKGIKNLAYAIHYIVDVGTPYHSITVMDIQEEYYEKLEKFIDKEDGSKSEYNNINLEFLNNLLCFVAGHPYFEKKVLFFFENQPYRRELLNTINKKVRELEKVPEFKHPEESTEWFTDYIQQLRNASRRGYKEIDKLFKLASKNKSNNIEEELNRKILEFSKWCISNITLVITITLLYFLEKRKKKNTKTYIRIIKNDSKS